MGDRTAIEWADASWNPVTGCTKVSSGCKSCYAERVSKRMGVEFTKVTEHPKRLGIPLRWIKPRKIFVCSMADLFHRQVTTWFIDRVFDVIYQTPEHTYLILTKRPERMGDYVTSWGTRKFQNVWFGVSCEAKTQLSRLHLLRQIPAAVRFVSFEPLLEDLGKVNLDGIHWCIVGGESGGPPERALVRKCGCRGNAYLKAKTAAEGCGSCHGTGWSLKGPAYSWLTSIRDQCTAAGVPFFLKQFGGPRPTSGGRLLDGREWNEYPEVRL